MIYKVVIVISLVVVLGMISRRYIRRYELRKRVMADATNDYTSTAINITKSIANSKALYKELIGKTHPDRFVSDINKQEKAAQLASLITASKRNYRELLLLKERVENEL